MAAGGINRVAIASTWLFLVLLPHVIVQSTDAQDAQMQPTDAQVLDAEVRCPDDASLISPCMCEIAPDNATAIVVYCTNTDVSVFARLATLADHGAPIQQLVIADSNIDVLPAKAFSNLSISELGLVNCSIARLDDDSLSGLEGSLSTLSLKANRLTSVPASAIVGFTGLVSLNLNENAIEAVEAEDFRTNVGLGALYLDRNKIVSVHEEAFLSLTNLISLDMVANRLTSISATWFTGMKATVARIQLHENRIAAIPADAFSGLTNLQHLSLYDNKIATLGENAFAQLYLIELLRLENNLIEWLPADMFHDMGQLATITLDNNKIRQLPAAIFSNQTQVSEVFLEDNQISDIGEGAFSGLVSAEYMQLQANNLSSLPAELFTNMRSLTYLHLAENSGLRLQAAMFSGLSNLRSLNLYDAGITEVPSGTFAELVSLHSLYLQNNNITTLEADSFKGATNLEVLQLHDNQRMDRIPRHSFAGLAKLKRLQLQNNQIGEVEPGGLDDAERSLEFLQLSNNRLDESVFDSLSSCHELKHLDLSQNRMTVVPSSSTQNMKQLKYLMLGENQLEVVCPSGLAGPQDMSSVYLDGNNLRYLTSNILPAGTKAPTTLSLQDNPIHCDCHLAWITSRAEVSTINGACVTPAPLEGVSLHELHDGNLSCSATQMPLDARCDYGSEARDVAVRPASISSTSVTLSWQVASGVQPDSFVVGYFIDPVDLRPVTVSRDNPAQRAKRASHASHRRPEETTLAQEFRVEDTLGLAARAYTFASLADDTGYRTCVIMQIASSPDQQACVAVQTASASYSTPPVPTVTTATPDGESARYAGWVLAIAIIASVVITATVFSLLFIGYLKRNLGSDQQEKDYEEYFHHDVTHM